MKNFKLLDENNYSAVFEIYKQGITFTPVIAAVLDKSQMGEVYKLNASGEDCFLVNSYSGYAEVFGNFTEELQEELKAFMLAKKFSYPLFRLYNSSINNFYSKFEAEFIDTRQRFKLDTLDIINSVNLTSEQALIAPISYINFDQAYSLFSPILKFWGTKENFLLYGRGIACFIDGEIASLCYASAVSNNIVDINIMTNEKYRKQGYAKLITAAFIRNCYNDGLTVIWDCYTENVGSMALAKSLGFVPKYDPYYFVTVEK